MHHLKFHNDSKVLQNHKEHHITAAINYTVNLVNTASACFQYCAAVACAFGIIVPHYYRWICEVCKDYRDKVRKLPHVEQLRQFFSSHKWWHSATPIIPRITQWQQHLTSTKRESSCDLKDTNDGQHLSLFFIWCHFWSQSRCVGIFIFW